jgi:colicin import membrane protein
MTDRTPAALMTSLALHALVVTVVLLFTYSATFQSKEPPKIFELVAGEGNNYMATEAPALGTPGGVKLNVPTPPAPKPEVPAKVEPAPVQPEPAPVTPAPVAPPKAPPTKAATKAPPTPRTPAQEIRRQLANADLRAKRAVAKERAEEEKRAAAAAKVQHIDAAGIAKGVVGGSESNKDGGAGGKALSAEAGPAMQKYFSKLKQNLESALEKPAGIGDTLVVTVEFRLAADGTISGVRITKPSGSREFDDAVRAAFRRVTLVGPRPDGKSEVLELDFKAKDEGE